MNNAVVVLVMQDGKKTSYQINPDGSETYNKDRKVTRSFVRAFNIARLEAKKSSNLIKVVEIPMPEDLKAKAKDKPEAEKADA